MSSCRATNAKPGVGNGYCEERVKVSTRVYDLACVTEGQRLAVSAKRAKARKGAGR